MNGSVKNKNNGLITFAVSLLSTVFAASLIVFSEQAKQGAAEGLIICRDVILVSVFPFSIAASLLIGSGALGFAGRLAGAAAGRIFGISSAGVGVVLLGAVGGFPTGAYAASELYSSKTICKEEAERIISYTNNPTPAFMIGYIGDLVGSAGTGLFCYLCVLFSSFLWGFLIRKRNGKIQSEKAFYGNISFSGAVKKSAASAVAVCGSVIVFSVIARIISGLIPDQAAGAAICSVFEISSGAAALCSIGAPLRLTASLLCALCSFSGVCIMSQVKTEAESAGLRIKYYVIGKAAQSVFSFCLCYALYPLFFG